MSAAMQIRIDSANANGEKTNTSTLHAALGIAGQWVVDLVVGWGFRSDLRLKKVSRFQLGVEV